MKPTTRDELALQAWRDYRNELGITVAKLNDLFVRGRCFYGLEIQADVVFGSFWEAEDVPTLAVRIEAWDEAEKMVML